MVYDRDSLADSEDELNNGDGDCVREVGCSFLLHPKKTNKISTKRSGDELNRYIPRRMCNSVLA